jgi:type II secretory pathway component PulK
MLKRLAHDESGIALVLALMTMFCLTIVSSTVIYYTTASGHTSKLSQTRDQAYRFAEAGINNAMAILGQPPDPESATTPSIRTCSAVSPVRRTRPGARSRAPIQAAM